MARPRKAAPESPAAPFAPEALDALIGDARTALNLPFSSRPGY
jgi:hypothetical protein